MNLSQLFRTLDEKQEAVSSASSIRNGVANEILQALQESVKSEDIKKDELMGVVQGAYIANCWNMKGVIDRSNYTPAPKTVQTYTAAIRKAVKMELDPCDYNKWSEFRAATKTPAAAKWYDKANELLKILDGSDKERLQGLLDDAVAFALMEMQQPDLKAA